MPVLSDIFAMVPKQAMISWMVIPDAYGPEIQPDQHQRPSPTSWRRTTLRCHRSRPTASSASSHTYPSLPSPSAVHGRRTGIQLVVNHTHRHRLITSSTYPPPVSDGGRWIRGGGLPDTHFILPRPPQPIYYLLYPIKIRNRAIIPVY